VLAGVEDNRGGTEETNDMGQLDDLGSGAQDHRHGTRGEVGQRLGWHESDAAAMAQW
jgi:hypothetical protein